MSDGTSFQPGRKFWFDDDKPEHPQEVLDQFGHQMHILGVTEPMAGSDLTREYWHAILELDYDFARAREAVDAWFAKRKDGAS